MKNTWCQIARRAGRVGGLVLVVVFGTGCPDNAFLELEVCLPEQSVNAELARVQVLRLRGDVTLDGHAWQSDSDNDFPLKEGQPFAADISVESTKENADLGVRVSFCEGTVGCAEKTTYYNELPFVIRDPFTIGERSRATLDARDVPVGRGATTVYTCANGQCLPEGRTTPVRCSDAPSDDAGPEDGGGDADDDAGDADDPE